jgi:hypothetical protein
MYVKSINSARKIEKARRMIVIFCTTRLLLRMQKNHFNNLDDIFTSYTRQVLTHHCNLRFITYLDQPSEPN